MVVVENYNENGEKAGQGSGYLFSADGIVITNYHVTRGASALLVRFSSKSETRVESLLGYNIESDVAALQVPASSVPRRAATYSDEVDQVIRQQSIESKRQVQEHFSSVASRIEGRQVTSSPAVAPPTEPATPGMPESTFRPA